MTTAVDEIQMNDVELLREFRRARNQRQQIRILADLNLCSPYEIAARLEVLGALEGTGIAATQFSRRYSPIKGVPTSRPAACRAEKGEQGRPRKAFDETRALQLWYAGLNDTDMARELGIGIWLVERWRRRNGLLRTAPHRRAD